MSRLDDLFADYASYHSTAGNKICHRFGIPMIVLSLLGMLSCLDLPGTGGWVDAALLVIVGAAIFYFALDWRYGAVMLVVSLAAWVIGTYIPLSINVVLFVLGWILQFLGHGLYERKAPAFARNLTHLLVGPIWILSDLMPSKNTAQTSS